MAFINVSCNCVTSAQQGMQQPVGSERVISIMLGDPDMFTVSPLISEEAARCLSACRLYNSNQAIGQAAIYRTHTPSRRIGNFRFVSPKTHAYPHAGQWLKFKTLLFSPHDISPFDHEISAFWPVFRLIFRSVTNNFKTVRLHFAVN